MLSDSSLRALRLCEKLNLEVDEDAYLHFYEKYSRNFVNFALYCLFHLNTEGGFSLSQTLLIYLRGRFIYRLFI
ncbi:MAG: hypothetical protein BWK80_43015 [Desulfobacteraceae bacterium IS3]|nr:MAG: hypothetical protein BWK80_43015 [Desulfobacteraceae bacterium IS3]